MSQITNENQLKIAEDKVKDLAKLIIKTYDDKPFEDLMMINSVIGGLVERMSKIQEDMYQFLKGVE